MTVKELEAENSRLNLLAIELSVKRDFLMMYSQDLRAALEFIASQCTDLRQWDHPPAPKVSVCRWCENESPVAEAVTHEEWCPTRVAREALVLVDKINS